MHVRGPTKGGAALRDAQCRVLCEVAVAQLFAARQIKTARRALAHTEQVDRGDLPITNAESNQTCKPTENDAARMVGEKSPLRSKPRTDGRTNDASL